MASDVRKSPPVPASPPEGHYSIVQARQMVGKTIAKVDAGHREQLPNGHQTELIVIHFTDGSALAIDTGSNAQNVCSRIPNLKPSDFSVDFMREWY